MWSPVISGIPQGSLGLIMFLNYVNVIQLYLTQSHLPPSYLLMIPKSINGQINKVEDSIALQSDLNTLDQWTDRWQIKFNPSKREVMRITHNKDKSTTRYQVSGTESNKLLGLLKCTVGNKNKEIFSILYKTLARPILEYTSPVWSPHLAKDIHEIEKVQRRALLITLGQRLEEIAYEDRGKILKWNSLERRREFLSLVECYKTAFNLNGLNFSDYFELLCGSTKTSPTINIRYKPNSQN